MVFTRTHTCCLAMAGLALAACTSTENFVTDLITSEHHLPPEVRVHEDMSTEDLVLLGSPGLKQFVVARRFEAGTHGFPINPQCALLFYQISGKTMTVLRENRAAGGSQRITYLGFPQARAAARRIEASGYSAELSQTTCLSTLRMNDR